MKKRYIILGVVATILLMFVFFFLGSWVVIKASNIPAVMQFCDERGYQDSPFKFERWNFEGEELFTIWCLNKEGYFAVAETFPIFNEVHTGCGDPVDFCKEFIKVNISMRHE